jgi:BirA family biotin operon repressor/biotin-[acetyl-CoA-carboxylase] ligase
MSTENNINSEAIEQQIIAGLKTQIIARELKYYSTITSTNQKARALAEADAPDGTMVIAEIQDEGRGRRGRAWVSPQGGLWLTLVLRPNIPPNHASIITLLTGVVVAKTIRKFTKLDATVKWPNDVRIHDKKVCGILTEISTEPEIINYILLGLGINVNIPKRNFPKELQNTVTSLQEELESELDRINFLKQLLVEFEKEYLKFSKSPANSIPNILKTWRQYSDTLGRNVKIETITGEITGLAAEISNDGALIVVTEHGDEHKIVAGDCIYLDQ